MPTSKEYFGYVFGQLSDLKDIAFRRMMGEYIIYYRGKTVGGVYDDRLLVKSVKAAKNLMPDAPCVLPYEGAKPMLLVEEVDDKDFLKDLFNAMYEELPAAKSKYKAGEKTLVK